MRPPLKRPPTHPGAILREDVLPALQMSQGELAARLGVSRRTVNEVLNEHRSITPDFALRIGRLLGHTAESYLRMQTAFDLWHCEQTGAAQYAKVERLEWAA